MNKKVEFYLIGEVKEEEIYYHDMDNLNENDAKMMKSRLVQSYINLSVYFMKLGNFTESMNALKEAEMIDPQNSQLFYRKAQAIANNKDSSIKQLQEASQIIERAIELLQQNEEFMLSKKGLAKSLGLETAQQDYEQQKEFINKRIIKEQELSLIHI
eukprot:TRINITY_DN42313_c0_g1_i1.p3 TRINITY_DN42313_c0_g1~~TRINITY_DN42313_c0_g1_i1.p3  ORF type:complete len:157 (+),score=37.48 TRINITY_DN42313_c0_g1_i1:509-979(+)